MPGLPRPPRSRSPRRRPGLRRGWQRRRKSKTMRALIFACPWSFLPGAADSALQLKDADAIARNTAMRRRWIESASYVPSTLIELHLTLGSTHRAGQPQSAWWIQKNQEVLALAHRALHGSRACPLADGENLSGLDSGDGLIHPKSSVK